MQCSRPTVYNICIFCIKGVYGSRAVTLSVLMFDDVINWILQPCIQTNILVYMTLDVGTTVPVKFIRRGILASRLQ